MKKYFLAILLLLPVISSGANPKFVEFALKQAHSTGFFGCDKAIKIAFGHAVGDDIRVLANWFQETKNDSLRLTATYGSKGDSVFIEAEFRKVNKKCYMYQTLVLTSPKSCVSYANEMKAFKFIATAVDYSWMKNQGGVPMFLKPLNSGCVAIFQLSNYY